MAEVVTAATDLIVEVRSPERLVVHLVGDLDLGSVEVLEPKVTELLGRDAREVTIDATRLEFMDTSGIALLLRLANRFPSLKVEGASSIIARCVAALGLTHRLGMVSDSGRAERSFFASPASIREARSFVAEQLADLPEELRTCAVVLASELCTNAVIHVGDRFVVTLQRTDGCLRISVADPSDRQPEVLHPTESDPHGRGLQLVDALADRWGVERVTGTTGKVVWLELDMSERSAPVAP